MPQAALASCFGAFFNSNVNLWQTNTGGKKRGRNPIRILAEALTTQLLYIIKLQKSMTLLRNIKNE